MNIKVTIFEDNKSLRNGLFQLVNGSEGFKCVGAFEDCLNLMANIEETKPDVVLMDIQMPGINGIEAVGMIREKYPNLKILISGFTDNVGKPPDNLILSNGRAQAVINYLLSSKKIGKERLQSKGYGQTKPVSGLL